MMRRVLADVEFGGKVSHVLRAIYLWLLVFFDKVIEIGRCGPTEGVMQSVACEDRFQRGPLPRMAGRVRGERRGGFLAGQQARGSGDRPARAQVDADIRVGADVAEPLGAGTES